MITTSSLIDSEFNPYYGRYIAKLNKNLEIRKGFLLGKDNVIGFFNSIPTDKLDFSYESGKWSIKEILQHLIDTERIFIYRCFRIARNDKTSLAGFDQNVYVDPSNASNKTIESITNEFGKLRESSISLLNSLSDENLNYIGDANGGVMSARAAAFTIIGHEIWHIDVIKERYL